MGGLRTLLSPKTRHCMVQTTDSELLYIRELFKPESRPNRHSFSQSPFLDVSASLVVSMHSPVFRSYIYNFSPCARSMLPLRLCALLQVTSRLLQVEIALLICSSGSEACADESRPCSAAEQDNREDDTETETDGRLDEEVGQAAIPLDKLLAPGLSVSTLCEWLTFSLRRVSLTGREMALDGAGDAVLDSAIVICRMDAN